MLEKIKVADATNIVEELSEVLFILITSSSEMFKSVVSNPNNKESVSNSSDSSSEDENVASEHVACEAALMDTYVSPTKWEKIVSNVNYISKLKQKSFPSISNKTIFKHMDIIDDADI